MNDSESILAELRRIAAWADLQRKITKGSFIVLGFLIPGMIVFGVIMERRLTTTIENLGTPEPAVWSDVDKNVRLGDCDKAILIGETLLPKTLKFPEAHRRLAGAYLAAGNLEKAREHYAEAVRLFPSEENEKLLTAIDKRMKADNPQSDAATGAAPPPR